MANPRSHPPPGESPLGPDPFVLSPADPGAQQYEDLTPGERATAERGQEWAELESGEPVHNGFSAAVQYTIEMSRVEDAERASGLDGAETLGVVP
jgi:hypothetical protein